MTLWGVPIGELAGWIAAIFPFLASIPYTRAIINGTTIPSKTTWLVWTIVGFTLFWLHFETGARYSIWLPLVYPLLFAWYTLLAFRYGTSGWTKIDVCCLIGAAVSWMLWITTHSVVIALTTAVITDFFGSIPTIKTAMYDPGHENRAAWSIATVGIFINLFAIENWHSAEPVYPVYLFFNTVLIAGLLHFRPLITKL